MRLAISTDINSKPLTNLLEPQGNFKDNSTGRHERQQVGSMKARSQSQREGRFTGEMHKMVCRQLKAQSSLGQENIQHRRAK